ncbi:MAG: hypothetical protein AAGB12_06905 [Pseudomonadota bacterium]
MIMKILVVALPVPLRRTFDYRFSDEFCEIRLQVGMRVCVPFGHQKMVGVILGVKVATDIDEK